MRKYEFDVAADEMNDYYRLLSVASTVYYYSGQINEYERVGPGGGNNRFVVEIPEARAAGFEEWLVKQGQDLEAARA